MVILINKLIKTLVLGCFIAHLVCLGLCAALCLGRFKGMQCSLVRSLKKSLVSLKWVPVLCEEQACDHCSLSKMTLEGFLTRLNYSQITQIPACH